MRPRILSRSRRAGNLVTYFGAEAPPLVIRPSSSHVRAIAETCAPMMAAVCTFTLTPLWPKPQYRNYEVYSRPGLRRSGGRRVPIGRLNSLAVVASSRLSRAACELLDPIGAERAVRPSRHPTEPPSLGDLFIRFSATPAVKRPQPPNRTAISPSPASQPRVTNAVRRLRLLG